MRIVVLTTSYPVTPGDFRGAFVADLNDALARMGHSVRTVTPTPAGALFRKHGALDALKAEPWRALELPVALGGLAAEAAWALRDAGLLISHWMLPCGVVAAALSALTGKPHILVEHGGSLRLLPRSRPAARLLAFCLGNATVAHFVSPALKMDALSRLTTRERVELEERCSVLPMPPAPAPTVRSRTYAPPLRVLFAGRLDPSKGVDLLLQAVARTRFCRLTIAGSGPLAATLQPAVQRAGIEDRVDIVGLVPHNHLPELMSRHDVLVVPSLAPSPAHAALAEGTPAVLLEGMASGLVPVVSDVGGMAAWVRNGRNGLVFAQADVAALAAHLRFLSSNPRAAARLAAAALATAATCTHPRLVQTWAQHIPHLA